MSQKTIVEKLQIKENYRVLFVYAPVGYISSIGEFPPKVTLTDKPAGTADLIQFFVRSRMELERELGNLKSILAPKGLLWVTYPKESSKMKADINRDTIRGYADAIGLTAVSLVSIDDTWSALRLKHQDR